LDFFYWDDFSDSLKEGAAHFNCTAKNYSFDADSTGRCDAGLAYHDAASVCHALMQWDDEKGTDCPFTGYCADMEWIDAAIVAKDAFKKELSTLNDGLEDWIITGEYDEIDPHVIERHYAAVERVADILISEAESNFIRHYQAEWDYMRSQEYFIEECEANEREFDADGNMI
jgi:hypothetical protein